MSEISYFVSHNRILKELLKASSERLSRWMEIAAGSALIGVMLLIGADIVGRIFGHPVPGAYEIVSFAGGLVIGLAVPCTSKAKGHVFTDLLLTRLPDRMKSAFVVMTRSIGIFVFSLTGCSMIMMGTRLRAAGEVTAVLSLPFYYVAYILGGAFLVQVLVLISEMSSGFPVQGSEFNPEQGTLNGERHHE
jgi:TRAP-type C4-dicarboxylate transport system permease small subunit